MARDYKNIRAWQEAKKFTLAIYVQTRSFPKEELYGIISQLRRAAISVATNIAEGASRQHKRDYLNFLYTAKASLAEVECLIGISHDLDYLSDDKFESLNEQLQKTVRPLYGLIKSVEAEV